MPIQRAVLALRSLRSGGNNIARPAVLRIWAAWRRARVSFCSPTHTPLRRGVWAASLRPVPKGGTGLPACRSTQGGAGLRSNLSFDYRPIEVRRCPRTLFKPAAFRRSKLRLYGIQLRRNRSVHARLFSRTFGLQSVVTL